MEIDDRAMAGGIISFIAMSAFMAFVGYVFSLNARVSPHTPKTIEGKISAVLTTTMFTDEGLFISCKKGRKLTFLSVRANQKDHYLETEADANDLSTGDRVKVVYDDTDPMTFKILEVRYGAGNYFVMNASFKRIIKIEIQNAEDPMSEQRE